MFTSLITSLLTGNSSDVVFVATAACHYVAKHRNKQESHAVARKPRDAAAVNFL